MTVRGWAEGAVAEATGRDRRVDPVTPGNGGPAGNANLTAWTGLLLLVLFLVELATLLDVDGLISWHIVVGVLLVPPALLKTATTGWRIVRYYTGGPQYVRAGPPTTLLRILGPLVVLSTLAVLGSGLALVALGPDASRSVLITLLGRRIDVLTIHQGTFILWAVFTGLHLLGRLWPAMRIVTAPRNTGTRLPGGAIRVTALTATVLAAGLAAVLVLGAAGSWTSGDLHHQFDHHHGHSSTTTRPG